MKIPVVTGLPGEAVRVGATFRSRFRDRLPPIAPTKIIGNFLYPKDNSFRQISPVKVTAYFELFRNRPDRAIIKDEWIERTIAFPEAEALQKDGRIRRWASVEEMGGRYLRVVLLEDGITVHNAFFDRGYKP